MSNAFPGGRKLSVGTINRAARASGYIGLRAYPDDLMGRIVRHGRVKRLFDAHTLEILAAFTAMQNRLPGALHASRYGLHFCGFRPKDKAKAFMSLSLPAAKQLVPQGINKV